MKRQAIPVLASIVLLSIFGTSTFAATASFQGLGDLPGNAEGDFGSNYFFSWPHAVSDDGAVVVGRSTSTVSNAEGFRWEAGQMTGLGDLFGGGSYSPAYDLSADGSVAVGHGESASGYEAYRWENGVMTGLGDLSGGTFFSQAFGVSGDGSVVVGKSSSGLDDQAFRWTAADGMVGLGGLSGNGSNSWAWSASHDGTVIVGLGESSFGTEAFRWENNIMTGLGDLPGGDFYSEAHDVSADGSVIVGYSRSALAGNHLEAFRWKDGLMTGLGDLPGGLFASEAHAVSADGSVVVGYSESGSLGTAFIWDADNGMRNLRDILINDFSLDLTGWGLEVATGVSGDGLTIVGYGNNPSGFGEGWIATLPDPKIIPAPGAVLLASIGLGMTSWLCRKRSQ